MKKWVGKQDLQVKLFMQVRQGAVQGWHFFVPGSGQNPSGHSCRQDWLDSRKKNPVMHSMKRKFSSQYKPGEGHLYQKDFSLSKT